MMTSTAATASSQSDLHFALEAPFIDRTVGTPGSWYGTVGASVRVCDPRRDSDADLVARLRAGDDAAFAGLVERNGGRMLAAVQRVLRDEEEARDAVQDAFLSAFKAIGSFNGEAKLSTWLHRIALNAALMRLRRRRHRAERPIDDLLPRFDEDGRFAEEPGRCVASSHELVESRETRAMVRRCIDRLPESYRTVLLMRDIDDLDTDEVAQLLGTTANAVKIRLHRARQALRTLIAQEMGDGAGRPS